MFVELRNEEVDLEEPYKDILLTLRPRSLTNIENSYGMMDKTEIYS
jgi:hypothetical protein